jgi:hypothetical protein
LFAALEVATGKIIATHSIRRRRVEFLDFMNSVTAAFPNRKLHGTTDFSVLQNELKGRPTKIVMVAFDLLYLDGYDLRSLPLSGRMALLKKISADTDIQFSESPRLRQGLRSGLTQTPDAPDPQNSAIHEAHRTQRRLGRARATRRDRVRGERAAASSGRSPSCAGEGWHRQRGAPLSLHIEHFIRCLRSEMQARETDRGRKK